MVFSLAGKKYLVELGHSTSSLCVCQFDPLYSIDRLSLIQIHVLRNVCLYEGTKPEIISRATQIHPISEKLPKDMPQMEEIS